jgi:hypothetical protein
MKKFVLLLLLLGFSFSFAQENYNYVILPKKFSFFKEENKFGLNELTKSFFEKEGFKVFFDNDIFPADLYQNRCLALHVAPVENNTMFITKIYFEIKDCNNNLLLKSEMATSKEKLLKTAYTQTFRQSLSSLRSKLNFKKEKSQQNSVVVEPKKEVVETSNTVASNIEKLESTTTTLYAIPSPNGYKLVNDKPETIFILKKTSTGSIFTAQKSEKSGVLIKKNDNWFFEYYEGEKLISEKVEVKF